MRRLILDISTIARWRGPPVGIVRVEHRLAQHVLRHWPDVVLAVYDGKLRRLRDVALPWRETVASLDAVIDVNTLDFRWRRSFWRNLVSIRYPLLMALQRLRLSGPGFWRQAAAALQKRLLGSHAGQISIETVLPVNMVLGPALRLGPADVVLRAGAHWQQGIEMLALQRELGFQLVALCYDLLPLTHPAFFPAGELPNFNAYWHAMLPAASRILCNAQCIARDVQALAAEQGFAVRDLALVPLGYTAPRLRNLPALRSPLRPKRFALFVSTIEPRKNHAMLLRAWRLVLQAGIPQLHGFHLVFVGRSGWMVEDVLAELKGPDAAIGQSVLHLSDIEDAELERLYQDAAFCLYPSQYEGFGLPIIEAFSHGKAVIASTGGALPETVAGLSPCLPPGDDAAWAAMLGNWIENPGAYLVWERKIAREFRYESWPEAAEKILQAAFA